MGADSSKEERSNSPKESRRRNQYVASRQQRHQEQSHHATYQSPPQAPTERSRAPYSYTTEHLQSAIKQASPNVLERPRAPYNYNSQELQHGPNQANVYPNLNVREEEFVYVQRSPHPSAPPASELIEPKVPPRPPPSSISRSKREPSEVPKPPLRAPPPTSGVPKIPPTTRPLLSETSTVPNIPPTLKSPAPVTNPVPTAPSNVKSAAAPVTNPVPTAPSNLKSPLAPVTSPVRTVSSNFKSAATPVTNPVPTAASNFKSAAVPVTSPVRTVPSDYKSPPPLMNPMPYNPPLNNPMPYIPSLMNPMPYFPPLMNPMPYNPPLMNRMSFIPPTSPTPLMNPIPNVPHTSTASASLRPPKITATQSPTRCEPEVKISPHLSPSSNQSPAASPNAPGSSRSANFPAKKNRPRSAAKNRSNNDGYSCSACGQRLGITIYQCLSGHSCCKDCRLAEKPCGNCRSDISDMRNIALEAYLAELTNPCQSSGCTLSFNAHEMERHLKECPFGEMDCPVGTFFGQCSTRCKVADMAAHFDACHKEHRTAEIDKEMYVFNICMETHKLFLIKNGPHTFLFHLKVHEKERKISMTVQLLGTKISAGKWTYEFHVYNKRQPLRKYLYVDSCQSISTPLDDIFEEGRCATLPLAYAMTFVNESALTYKFYIKKEMHQRGRRPRNNAAN